MDLLVDVDFHGKPPGVEDGTVFHIKMLELRQRFIKKEQRGHALRLHRHP